MASKDLMGKPVLPEKLDIWMESYSRNLEGAIQQYPEKYNYPLGTTIDTVLSRMRTAFTNGTYNKESIAIHWTCEDLKIPYTYWGINNYLTGGLD